MNSGKLKFFELAVQEKMPGDYRAFLYLVDGSGERWHIRAQGNTALKAAAEAMRKFETDVEGYALECW